MKETCFLKLLLFFYGSMLMAKADGQSVAINNSGAVADASAMLDVGGNQKGLLIPRLSTQERNNVTNPAKALLIFNTTTNRFEVNTGSANLPVWDGIVTISSLTSNNSGWKLGGNVIENNIEVLGSQNPKSIGLITNNIVRIYVDSSSGKIGINSSDPKASLHIATTDAIILPTGTTAQRPVVPVPGMIRYNSETGKLEGYTTAGWKSLQF
jgi:hypothetical protein